MSNETKDRVQRGVEANLIRILEEGRKTVTARGEEVTVDATAADIRNAMSYMKMLGIDPNSETDEIANAVREAREERGLRLTGTDDDLPEIPEDDETVRGPG